ncbi:MAG: serine/threonine protein kinase [Kiritimatiellia bacterium]
MMSTLPSINDYHLPNLDFISLLGIGGMSTVWKARQLSLDRLVAVKVLSRELAANQEDRDRFIQEARACAALDHPGIMRVYDVASYQNTFYIVMELIDGYTMGQWLRRKARLDSEDVLIILESVAYALDYAWQTARVVHCDIKPDNIMIDRDGTVKVTDMGLAQSLATTVQTATQEEVIGTPAYISPEQACGETDLDCRSDIYSLGATLYHLLTGHTLFPDLSSDQALHAHVQPDTQAPDIRSEIPGVSDSFARVLAKMLAKDRRDRYADWLELVDDIKRLYANEPAGTNLSHPFISSMQLNS